MSMPFTQFSCDRCEFTADSTVLWGMFTYQLEDGQTMNVDRCLGWCHQCNTVTAIEDLSGEGARNQISEAEQELASIINKSGIWNLLNRLFSSHARLQEINHWHEKKADGERTLAFLAHRSDPPRCLFCSSTAVAKLPQARNVDRDNQLAIGFTHPECGGQLFAIKSSYSVSIEPSNRSYSPSGVFMRGDS